MANSVHSSSPNLAGPSAGQPPIVLARLPRVGHGVSAPAQPPPPEPMPPLDLHTEIEQRVQLQVAETPNDKHASHFVDRRHAIEQEPMVRQQATVPWMEEPDEPQQRPSPARSTTFSEKVFQLHSQLSPHAGLIVTLALITSAGLLYWMIVGPAQVPSPYYENYGPELRDEHIGATGVEGKPMAQDQIPDDYLPEFSAIATKPPAPTNNSDGPWTQVPLPSQAPSPVKPAPQAEQHKPVPVNLNPLPATGILEFPTTTRPNKLDFSRIPSNRPAESPAPELLPLPEIARAPTDTTHR